MSTQSVKSASSEGQVSDAPNAAVQVTGRNVEIPDHYRVYVGQKLARAERIDHSIQRFDVELTHENNRRQRKNCQHVEITAHGGRGPVVRGEGRADTFYGAFEAAVHKLESRLRRGKDRRKVHYGDKTPVSLHQATAAAPVLDVAEAFKPDGAGHIRGTGFEFERQVVVRGLFKGDVPDHFAAAVVGRHGVEPLLLAVQGADTGWSVHFMG